MSPFRSGIPRRSQRWRASLPIGLPVQLPAMLPDFPLSLDARMFIASAQPMNALSGLSQEPARVRVAVCGVPAASQPAARALTLEEVIRQQHVQPVESAAQQFREILFVERHQHFRPCQRREQDRAILAGREYHRPAG